MNIIYIFKIVNFGRIIKLILMFMYISKIIVFDIVRIFGFLDFSGGSLVGG